MNINQANKLNMEIIKNAKTPHERDLARMRMNILKGKGKKNGRTIKPVRG